MTRCYPFAKRYLLAIGLFLLCLTIARVLDAPSSCFILGVMISSLYGGRGPALLATILGSAAFVVYFLPSASEANSLRVGVFIGAMLLTTEVIETERRSAGGHRPNRHCRGGLFPELVTHRSRGPRKLEPGQSAQLAKYRRQLGRLGGRTTIHGGRIRAGVDQVRATYRETLAVYEKTVISAYQEVEDQLSALHFLASQAQLQDHAVADAKRAEQLALERFKQGLVSYRDVVSAQRARPLHARIAWAAVNADAFVHRCGSGGRIVNPVKSCMYE